MAMKKDSKTTIIDIYIKIVKEKKMSPTRTDLLDRGVSRDTYRANFGNLDKLSELARAQDPEAFKNLIDEKVFTPKIFKKLKGEVAKYKKFVITTAVTGMPVHSKFYANLKYYCKVNNALLLILPSSDPATKGWELDGSLAGEHIVFDDLALNSNLFISSFKTSAKQTNPLTGIKRIGQRERSMIVASTKQFLEYVPVSNEKMSHALMTTGSLTLPRYRETDRYMSQRTAYIAEFDHKIAAIVVDIKDDNIFQFRQIQAEYSNGYFIDIGKYYKINKIEKTIPEAITLGDIHVGETDPVKFKASEDMIKTLKPKRIFLHDVFDGASISHHTKDQHLTRAEMNLTLKQELEMTKDELERLSKKHSYVNEWIIVRSNHDDFIDRYLQDGSYTKDHKNSRMAHEIALSRLKKNKGYAFEAGLRILGFDSKKFNFLGINSSYKIQGLEHGTHGHLGLNGSRNASNASLEVGYGPGVYGHSHTAGILREVFRVGTSTFLRVGYNNGSSSWTQTDCITYKNGSRQLINIINGDWK